MCGRSSFYNPAGTQRSTRMKVSASQWALLAFCSLAVIQLSWGQELVTVDEAKESSVALCSHVKTLLNDKKNPYLYSYKSSEASQQRKSVYLVFSEQFRRFFVVTKLSSSRRASFDVLLERYETLKAYGEFIGEHDELLKVRVSPTLNIVGVCEKDLMLVSEYMFFGTLSQWYPKGSNQISPLSPLSQAAVKLSVGIQYVSSLIKLHKAGLYMCDHRLDQFGLTIADEGNGAGAHEILMADWNQYIQNQKLEKQFKPYELQNMANARCSRGSHSCLRVKVIDIDPEGTVSISNSDGKCPVFELAKSIDKAPPELDGKNLRDRVTPTLQMLTWQIPYVLEHVFGLGVKVAEVPEKVQKWTENDWETASTKWADERRKYKLMQENAMRMPAGHGGFPYDTEVRLEILYHRCYHKDPAKRWRPGRVLRALQAEYKAVVKALEDGVDIEDDSIGKPAFEVEL